MAIPNHADGFDDFRRARRRQQARTATSGNALGYENSALRELEQVEARESRDQQLTREVHDFFAAATRQAASIVERVAHDAQVEAGARIEQQMESFLIDSLARMNTFVVTVMQQRRNQHLAETEMQPTVANIVGQQLDEFRWEGTADTLDKHIGQDPFATSVEEVQREFRAQVKEPEVAGEAAEPIEHHLVAEMTEDAPAADAAPESPPLAEEPPVGAEPVARTTREAAPAAGQPGGPAEELERFKSALKALVRQGVMNRQEASAAWQARLASLGYQGGSR